jgi:signal transduction histidine kinase
MRTKKTNYLEIYENVHKIYSSLVDNKDNIIYHDNGIGISDDIVDNIYEPFFTTKRAEGSTGLGLNIVYNIN